MISWKCSKCNKMIDSMQNEGEITQCPHCNLHEVVPSSKKSPKIKMPKVIIPKVKEQKPYNINNLNGWQIFVGAVFAIVLIFIMGYREFNKKSSRLERNNINRQQNIEIPRQESHKEQIEEWLFDPWDGSCILLRDYLKSIMLDPDSYRNIETSWQEIDHSREGGAHYIRVTCRYSGTNAFGGRVTNVAQCHINMEGHFRIIEDYVGY